MIYVFKTSVSTKKQVKQLKPFLDGLLPCQQWNFDLTDCDKILRIVSEENIVLKITSFLQCQEFRCEELD